MRPSKARSELSVGLACHLRWVTYEDSVHFAACSSHTRGGSRMRESRTSGLCGGRILICVPTAIRISPTRKKQTIGHPLVLLEIRLSLGLASHSSLVPSELV